MSPYAEYCIVDESKVAEWIWDIQGLNSCSKMKNVGKIEIRKLLLLHVLKLCKMNRVTEDEYLFHPFKVTDGFSR